MQRPTMASRWQISLMQMSRKTRQRTYRHKKDQKSEGKKYLHAAGFEPRTSGNGA